MSMDFFSCVLGKLAIKLDASGQSLQIPHPSGI